MLKRIYIVQETGVCLYEMNFMVLQTQKQAEKNTRDPQLFSGLFSAIITFAENTISDGPDTCNINMVSFKNLNFYFSHLKHYYIVVELDSTEKSFLIKDIVEIIEFSLKTYEDYITKGIFDPESGECIQDPTFEELIRNHIGKIIRANLFSKK